MIWESVLNRRIDQKTHELQIEKNNLQVIIDNINAPVSYTHLDVYKRQALRRLRPVSCRIGMFCRFGSVQLILPCLLYTSRCV